MSTQNNDILNTKLTPKQAKKAMAAADAAVDSLMIWGAPGIGKSAIARQYADENYPLRKNAAARVDFLEKQIEALKQVVEDAPTEESRDDAKADLRGVQRELETLESKLIDQDTNFIDFRLSQIEPTDLRGIPVPEKLFRDMEGRLIKESDLAEAQEYIAETAVVWAAPKVLKLPEDWKGVILFDEINSAMPIVQAASYQLILDRCVGEMKLPKTALVLAAGNRDTDGGVTFTLATPLRDRMTHIEVQPYHQDWIDDYAIDKKLNAATVAFISNTGAKYFNTLDPSSPSHAGGTSPRSWEVVAKYEDMNSKKMLDKEIYRAMVAGRITDGIAVEYIEYVENVAKLPDTMKILQGQIETIDEGLDISSNYFIALNLVYKIIDLYNEKKEQRITSEEWGTLANNFILFLERNFSKHQAELAVLAIRTITKAQVAISYKEVPAFQPFVKKYSELVRKARNLS